jgi:selenocysteine-specific elongation factor
LRHLVVGTAGHVDHGKSSLVLALTGIDPDRLQEEKIRGVTIDLGFADLTLPRGSISFVDVPGHERFVRHMVAGAAGIDAVLLVVAADEGVKPQTREHLSICTMLGLRHGLVVLTKSDLVDAEVLEVVSLETRDFLAGSFLEGAPLVPVSSRTGAGLDALRVELGKLFDTVPERPAAGVARLPIDRSFVLHGFGTVVTGTLVSGSIREGDTVRILPGDRAAKVRGIEVHHARVAEALAGQRTAVNLQGLAREEAPRGATLSMGSGIPVARRALVRLRLLPSAPKGVRRSGVLRFHQGTWEGSARFRVLADAPDGWIEAEMVLGADAVLLPGDRFVLRLPSPVGTVGGGIVVEPRPRGRRRGGAPFPLGEDAPVEEVVLDRLVRAGLTGAREGNLATALGLSAPEIARAVSALDASGRIARAHGILFARDAWSAAQDAILSDLAGFHRDEPLRPGAAREELRIRRFREMPREAWRSLLEEMERSGGIALLGERVALAGHRVVLSGTDRETAERIESAFRSAALDPPDPRDILAREPHASATPILEWLVAEERLQRIRDGRLFHRDALDELRARISEYGKRSRTIDVAAFKQLAGVTRKNAIPLLEQLDAERRTRRVGNLREILV